MDFRKQYLRHSDINQYLETLQSKYSDSVSVTTIGYSYENRPIKSIRISNDSSACSPKPSRTVKSAGVLLSNERRKFMSQRMSACRSRDASKKAVILIDAGIHAREWCSISAALYCISQLTENLMKNKILLQNFDFVIVPVVNVDGYEYSRTMVRTEKLFTESYLLILFFRRECGVRREDRLWPATTLASIAIVTSALDGTRPTAIRRVKRFVVKGRFQNPKRNC